MTKSLTQVRLVYRSGGEGRLVCVLFGFEVFSNEHISFLMLLSLSAHCFPISPRALLYNILLYDDNVSYFNFPIDIDFKLCPIVTLLTYIRITSLCHKEETLVLTIENIYPYCLFHLGENHLCNNLALYCR